MTAPAALSPSPGRIEVFAIGAQGTELVRRRFDGAWSEWESLGPLPALATEQPRLAVASPAPGRVDVFAIRGSNESAIGGSLFHRRVGVDSSDWEPFPVPVPFVEQVAASYGPGRIDLIIYRELIAQGSLRHRRFEGGSWSEWRAVPPELVRTNSALACTSRAGVDVFSTNRSQRLHHLTLEGPQPAVPLLGGEISSGLAAVSMDPGRIDVIAGWKGGGLLHRRFDGRWSAWRLVDMQPEVPASYSAVRPEDLVQLQVSWASMTPAAAGGGLSKLVAGPTGGRLIVRFSGQHVGEQVQAAEGARTNAGRAGESRLVFRVGPSETVLLTVPALLEAMSRLPLLTADPGTVPGRQETAIEMPWRLLLSPEAGAAASHLTRQAKGASGATELWHTRLTGPGGARHVKVRPAAALPHEHPDDPSDFQAALTDDNRAEIVRAASWGGPAVADQLILSAYGGWLSAEGSWPDAGVEWSHRAAMGRDYHVRVLTRGALFPFGHLAVFAEVTDRRFRQLAPSVQLERRTFLIVTEPVREYGHGAGGTHERGFPFQRVAIEPQVINPLDGWPPWIGAVRAFWPFRNGAPVEFALRARAGREEVEMRLPLLFVAESAMNWWSAASLDQQYSNGPPLQAGGTSGTPRAQIGRRIPLAMASATEPMQGAVQEVHSMWIGGEARDAAGPGFHPKVRELKVALPAARQLLGMTDPLSVRLSRDLEFAGPGQQPDVLLEINGDPLKIAFSRHSGRTGGLAAPDFSATRISRTVGPLAALPDDPRDLFDASAKLLGVVALRDVIKQIDRPPTLIWSEPTSGGPPTATFLWQAPLKSVPPFIARPGAMVELKVETKVEPQPPPSPPKVTTVTTGRVTNFTLHFLPGEDLVDLFFDQLHFVMRAGERPQVSFDLKDTQLLGKLKLVRDLQRLIPRLGAGGAQIDVSPSEIRVTYRTGLPQLAFGVFTLQNLALDTWLALSLRDAPLTVGFAFGTRERPFLVTVSMFGGGGYLELGIDPGGLQTFVGGIEFGASVAMDFVVARGEVHVFGGVAFAKSANTIEVTGYLRIGGSVELLGLISVSVELTLSLSYEERGNQSFLVGEARLVVKVDLTFWSTSVELSCHKEFAGSSLDGGDEPSVSLGRAHPATSVAAALEPRGDSRPIERYCRAFAVEVGHA